MNKKCDMKRGVAAIFSGPGQANPETMGESGEETVKVRPADSDSLSAQTFATQTSGGPMATRSDAALPEAELQPRKPVEGKIKATYYLDQALVTRMKHLAVDLKKKDSDMVAEGLLEVIMKYETR